MAQSLTAEQIVSKLRTARTRISTDEKRACLAKLLNDPKFTEKEPARNIERSFPTVGNVKSLATGLAKLAKDDALPIVVGFVSDADGICAAKLPTIA